MGLMADAQKQRLKEELTQKVVNPVKLLVFTQELACNLCAETRQLVQELSELNEKISFEVYDFVTDPIKVKEYGINKIPAIAVIGNKDYGIRFYGLPFGYELQTLVEAVAGASRRRGEVSENVMTMLNEVKTPVHVQVFVTLTCPHCSRAAITACRLAIASDLISTEIVDSGEFPHLATKYAVVGVPKVILNEKVEFVGALPEDLFLEHVILATTS